MLITVKNSGVTEFNDVHMMEASHLSVLPMIHWIAEKNGVARSKVTLNQLFQHIATMVSVIENGGTNNGIALPEATSGDDYDDRRRAISSTVLVDTFPKK